MLANEISSAKPGYSVTAKIFHWSFVVVFAYGVFKQIENINQLEDIALLKFEIIFAVLFIFFLIIRFFYMIGTQTSSLPSNTPKAQKFLAKIVHYGMYLGMVSIALSGLIIGCFYWVGLKDGFFINFLISWHETSTSTVFWLIGLHLSGSIFHLFKNDGVWESMVPFIPSKKK